MIVEMMEWITARLRLVDEATGVHYVQGTIDAPYPHITYWFPSGDPDREMGGFGTDDREYVFAVRAASMKALEAISLLAKADKLLRDQSPDLGPEWSSIGVVTWAGIVPDPGNQLPDRALVYYAGNMYSWKCSRVRTFA